MFRTSIDKMYGDSTNTDIVKSNFRSYFTTQTAFYKPKNPFQYRAPEGTGLGQKVIQYVMGMQEASVVSRFYGSSIVFRLPKFEGYLGQVIIECNLTTAGTNSDVQPRLGTRVFKQITLETQRGRMSIDRMIRPDYTNARLDSLSRDQNQIELSTDPDFDWSEGTVTCYCPCFFWLSETSANFLPVTSATEPLQIRAIVNDSIGDMGATDDISDFTFRAICTYYTHVYIQNVPKVLRNEPRLITDVYYEKAVPVPLSARSVSVPLTCPYPVFAMSIIIRDTNQENLRADSFTLYCKNNEVLASLNRRINYSLAVDKGATENNGEGALNYFFSLTRSRNKNTFVVNMRDLLNTTLTVNFSAAPSANFSCYVLFEYLTQLVVDDQGLGLFYRPQQF